MAGRGEGGYDPTPVYVFTVRFRLSGPPGVTLGPDTFETELRREADPPGEEGWLFFRDNLWRGEVNDPEHVRAMTEEALGVDVDGVEFEELRTPESYLADLRSAVADDLAAFRAGTVEEALSKYLGSSIRVVE